MTQEKRNLIIKKIQKLLALSQSPNKHEAELAMEQANKLLTKYNLSKMEVEGTQTEMNEFRIEMGARIPNWKKILLRGIAINNFCDLLIDPGRENQNFVLIGEEQNTQIVYHLYLYLKQAIERWAKNNAGKGSALKNSYKLGMVDGLVKRLEQQRKEQEQKGTEETTAVAVYDLHKKQQQKIQRYLLRNYRLRNQTPNINLSDSMEFEKGKRDSKNVNLNKQIH